MKIRLLLLFVGCFLLSYTSTYAQVSQFSHSGISYQGKLLKDGRPFEGATSILFELIDEHNSVKWSETQNVTIQRGLYAVTLGSLVAFPSNLFSQNNKLCLRVQVENEPAMVVCALSAVPYAYTAKNVVAESITSDQIRNNTIQTVDLASGGVDKILTTNAQGDVVWIDKSSLAANAATLGNAGGDISGNYANLQINANVITTTEIADNTIQTEDIADNSVTVEKLSDEVVETIKIRNNAVIASKIADNAITTSKIEDAAITTAKIQGGGNNKVMTTTGSGTVIWVDRSTFTSGSLGNAGGDLSGDYSELEINPNVITQTELADDAVSTTKIQDNSIVNSKLANDAVAVSNIQDNAITTSKIQDGAITLSKVQSTGNDLVLTTDGSGNVVWENRTSFATTLGSAGGDLTGTYDNLQLTPNVVTETELANSSVTPAKIQSTGNDLVLTTDGSGNVVWENRTSFATTLGSAGGDLTGTYDNLQLTPSVVTETELANSSVTPAKIQSTGNDLVLTTDGSGNVVWENRNTFSTNSLGSAGGDLTGTYDNLQLTPNAVTETELANSSVTPAKIQSTGNDLVLTTDGSGNVVWENRTSFATTLGSAGGDLTGTYDNLQINPNTITSTELVNDAVTTTKVQDGAITDTKITNVNPSKLQQAGATNGQVLKWNGSNWAPANDNVGVGTVTSYYSIDPFDFRAGLSEGGDESKNNIIVFENNIDAATIRKESEGKTIVSPIHLPHGATVQSITVYYLDDRSGSDNIDFYVDRKSFGLGTNVISSVSSNENNNSISSRTLSTSFMIDNQNYSYSFRVVFSIGGGSVDEYSEIEQAVYGVRVTYTTP